MAEPTVSITPESVRDHRALQRRWRGVRLTLIGSVAGTVIIALGLGVPQLAGSDVITQFGVGMSALVILLGSIVVAHCTNTIRRLSNTHRRLVMLAAILLGLSVGAPILTLSTIEAATQTLFPPAGQEEPPSNSWPTVVVGGGALIVWIVMAWVLCRPDREPTARRYLAWRIAIPVLLVIGVGVPSWMILSVGDTPFVLGDFAVIQLLILMLEAGWAGVAGYVFALYLGIGLRASAHIIANRDAPDIRFRTQPGTRRAAYALSVATLLVAGIAWLLAHDRIATLGFGLPLPRVPSPDQIPSLAITVFAGAALVYALIAWAIRRTRPTVNLLIATAVIVLCALAAAWIR
ncbi:hypothetical protein [Mycetocola saprophilus]|uniref:hypothetical protein n=1 Tax=Mycetocola saprophilus TaxID=76636 RepID=UPI0004C03720|nr:hypothetical protein [Mycetocola saprophilus]